MDSPPIAYGLYSKNISIIIPEGETIESCGHNTKGKDKISFDKIIAIKKIINFSNKYPIPAFSSSFNL